MTREIFRQTINDSQNFLISHFLALPSITQLLSCITLIKEKKIAPSPEILSPTSQFSLENVTEKNIKAPSLTRHWEKMHQDRLDELVSPREFEMIKYYLERRDETQQGIIAERTLRKLEQRSLELIRDMIQNPDQYPIISTLEQKNSLLEDWLFKHEHFSYCLLRRVPAYFQLLIEQATAFANVDIAHYFSTNSETGQITQRRELLSSIEVQLEEMNAQSEIYSDLTSDSGQSGMAWPKYSDHSSSDNASHSPGHSSSDSKPSNNFSGNRSTHSAKKSPSSFHRVGELFSHPKPLHGTPSYHTKLKSSKILDYNEKGKKNINPSEHH